MCETNNYCPNCGDRLAHHHNIGSNESRSGFGQWVHDNLPNEFYFMDGDAFVYKAKTQVLRFLEIKNIGDELKDSEHVILPFLATAIWALKHSPFTYKLNKESGVFVVWTESPYDYGIIQEVKLNGGRGKKLKLEGQEWLRFISGELMRDAVPA